MKINDVVTTLTKFEFVHSIILYGSRAVGTQREESDFDVCIIPDPGVSIDLKERIALENSIPQNIDLSLLGELPVNIRKRVFLEGKVLFTKDPYPFKGNRDGICQI
jgi:predicted nucleotidyltransferase